MPIVTIDGPSLQAIPGQRGRTALYVTNNSAGNLTLEVGRTFTNGCRPVQETRVIVSAAGPGQRLGVPVYGPRTDIFVDRVLCPVLTRSSATANNAFGPVYPSKAGEPAHFSFYLIAATLPAQ